MAPQLPSAARETVRRPRCRLGVAAAAGRRLGSGALLALLAGASAAGETLRFEARAFGETLRMEATADLPGTTIEASLLDAAGRILALERLTDPDGSEPAGLGALNAQAGRGARPIDPQLYRLLERSLSTCRWSAGAHGPLGGNLYALWGLRRSVGDPPSTRALRDQAANAACDRLELDPTPPGASLEKGSRLDLWGFAEGAAVDLAVESLLGSRLEEGWVEIGSISRAFGPGPDGEGWPLLTDAGVEGTSERVLLRDRALAVASPLGRRIELAGESYAPYLDQRRGRPVSGKIAVLAVAPKAVDAQALAVALFVMPNREGEFRLATLRADASAIWYLGTGAGPPLITHYRWSKVPKWQLAAGEARLVVLGER